MRNLRHHRQGTLKAMVGREDIVGFWHVQIERPRGGARRDDVLMRAGHVVLIFRHTEIGVAIQWVASRLQAQHRPKLASRFLHGIQIEQLRVAVPPRWIIEPFREWILCITRLRARIAPVEIEPEKDKPRPRMRGHKHIQQASLFIGGRGVDREIDEARLEQGIENFRTQQA